MVIAQVIVLIFIASSMIIINVSASPLALHHNPRHLQNHTVGKHDFSNTTDEQLRFMYFHAHDMDFNSKLDGSELVHCILHHVQEGKIYSDVELSITIDPILAIVDKNLDGFIDYVEYLNEPTSLGIGYLTLFLLPYSLVK